MADKQWLIAGKLGVVFTGNYDPTRTYRVNDVVTYNNILYSSEKSVSGETPGEGSSWVRLIAGSDVSQLATTEVAGIVKVDGTTITVDADGTLHGAPVISSAEDVTYSNSSEIIEGDNVQAKLENTEAYFVAEVDSIQSDISSITGNIEGIQGDVQSLGQDITDAKTDISGIQTGLAGIQSDVSELGTEVTRVAEEVDAIQSDISNIGGAIDTLSGKITNNTESIGKLNAKVLPATAASLGTVYPDNTTIVVDENGKISATAQEPSVATANEAGIVKPSASDFAIDASGGLTSKIQMSLSGTTLTITKA